MCITPMPIKDGSGCMVHVPCGKCPECRSRRASAWSFRLMQQDKISDSSQFITLTYDTKHVPISRNGFMELSKRDLQLFFKRLRKNAGKIQATAIKYYAVGEYGTHTRRPHYHIILFNARQEDIMPAWGLGHIHYGSLCAASVGYTLKYISKPSWKRLHKNDDRTAQFSLMSKGLGANYLTPQMVKWHKNDLENRMYLNLEGGKKCSMPRYYKDKIYSLSERQIIGDATAIRIAKKISDQNSRLTYDQYNNFIRDTKSSIEGQFNKMNSNNQIKSNNEI
ncbi:replication initiator protein [Blackfly microvirus SF02]|uniref:Replication initiator protein n=1 Tax=Blackfly microvirus SF02 TaxID=2576452 RepID=A0A4P8PKY7_9VIRU|nr:replication initiator protein [Blackfly microvirus SF02]